MQDSIRAVGLLADPGRVADAAEDTYTAVGSSPRTNVNGMSKGGIWEKAVAAGVTSGPLPTWVLEKTVSFCHPNDIVCHPRWGASIAEHTNYSGEELSFIARELRDR
ncbi:MAG: hypothetical protein GX593_03870 [Actinomycetales bacterium]|nr:hypothetical protein [Actinomycetales bacterium]